MHDDWHPFALDYCHYHCAFCCENLEEVTNKVLKQIGFYCQSNDHYNLQQVFVFLPLLFILFIYIFLKTQC